MDPGTLPKHLGALGLDEYHAPTPDTLPLTVTVLSGTEALAGRDALVRARVVDVTPPDSVALYLRPLGRSFERSVPMRPNGAYQS